MFDSYGHLFFCSLIYPMAFLNLFKSLHIAKCCKIILQFTNYILQFTIANYMANLAKIPVIFGRKFSGLTLFVFVLTLSSDIASPFPLFFF